MTAELSDRVTLTVEETARILGISRNSAYALIAEKSLPHLRLGRRIVVPRSALERLLAEATTGRSVDDR